MRSFAAAAVPKPPACPVVAVPDMPDAATFDQWPNFVTRPGQSRVLSIAKLRGRARGHGSELALACDMRFASKEKAFLAQVEVGVPGGGATEWLSALAGARARSRSSWAPTTSTRTPPGSTAG